MTSDFLFILGPTASGKSEIAHQMAIELGASILCMDSMQVYRGLEIGVGKPKGSERTEVEYTGLDLVEIDQPFDVAAYLKVAQMVKEEIQRKKKPLIIVGGTGLYYRALTRGLSPIPEIDPSVRETLELLALEDLQKELSRVDPEMMGRIDIQNPRRLIRALEVIRGTGISLGEWQKRNEEPLFPAFSAVFLNRENLRERIKGRAQEMYAAGWKDEVRSLVARWGEERIKGLAAIGYNHWVDVLVGSLSEKEALERIEQETWQYARRQLTWFRKESKYRVLNLTADSTLASVIETIRQSCGSVFSFPSALSPFDPQDSSCS